MSFIYKKKNIDVYFTESVLAVEIDEKDQYKRSYF